MGRPNTIGGLLARGDLPADKRQLRIARRAHENRFGIYRPATSSTEHKLGRFTAAASEVGEDYLARVRDCSAPLNPSDDGYGITIVPVRVLRRHLSQAIRHGGFEMHRMISRLEEHFHEPPLELDIESMSWLSITPEMKRDRRHLVFTFAETEAKERLREQYDVLESQLAKDGLYNIVNKPDNMHMTVLRYGRPGDGMSIGKRHANTLLEKVEEVREAQKLTTVRVEPIIVGPTYHVAHPELERRIVAMPREFAS